MADERTDTSAITQADVPPDSTSGSNIDTGEWEVDDSHRAKKILGLAGIAVIAFLALIGASVIVVGGFQTAFAFLTLQGIDSTASALPLSSGGDGEASQAPAVMQPLGQFVVNLLDPAKTRYINAKMALEVDKAATAKAIRNNQAQFRDAAISLMGNRTYAELMGLEGKARLREDLNVRFNRLLTHGKIHRVYFTEFVVQ